jgi:hypothetical protein
VRSPFRSRISPIRPAASAGWVIGGASPKECS